MTVDTAAGRLDARFGSPGATPREWTEVSGVLAAAEIYWLTTVRPGDRPHTTPVLGIWQAETLHFTTGREEQKARNLQFSPYCTMTTGVNLLNEGLDVVVEGEARELTERSDLVRLSQAYEAKYGSEWSMDEGEEGVRPLMFRIEATKIFAFGKGEPFSQTVWRRQM